MFRSVLRRLLPTVTTAAPPSALPAQFSACTGHPYPGDTARKMAALGFTSTTWLTRRQMDLVGVSLLPGQEGKCYTFTDRDGIAVEMYNVDQTSDPAQLVDLRGRLVPRDAFTGQKILADPVRRALIQGVRPYPSNTWLTEQQVHALGLALKAGAHARVVETTYTDKEQQREIATRWYNVGELEQPSLAEKAARLYPLSAVTGRRCNVAMALPLVRVALEKEYSSPIWLTEHTAQSMGVAIKPGEVGISVGVHDGQEEFPVLFNAQQTNNPITVARAANGRSFTPRSAMTGMPYPDPTRSQLKAAAFKNKDFTLYWLTKYQGRFMCVEMLPDAVPTPVEVEGRTVYYYNAAQTTDRDVVVAHGSRRVASIKTRGTGANSAMSGAPAPQGPASATGVPAA